MDCNRNTNLNTNVMTKAIAIRVARPDNKLPSHATLTEVFAMEILKKPRTFLELVDNARLEVPINTNTITMLLASYLRPDIPSPPIP